MAHHSHSPQPAELAHWCATVGRTVADCAALMFVLPVPANAYETCEAHIRSHVAAELVAVAGLMDVERQALENVAWLAFDRRLARHTHVLPLGGRA